jgi:hypothetical protein
MLIAVSVAAVLLAVVVGCRSGAGKGASLACTLLGTCWLAFSVSPGSPDTPDGPGLRARLAWMFSPPRATTLVFAPGLFYLGLVFLAAGAVIGVW